MKSQPSFELLLRKYFSKVDSQLLRATNYGAATARTNAGSACRSGGPFTAFHLSQVSFHETEDKETERAGNASFGYFEYNVLFVSFLHVAVVLLHASRKQGMDFGP